MPELLVRWRSKHSDDLYRDVQLTKRGDVIEACEDGHDWTPAELTNPDWRILKVPGLTWNEANALKSSEDGDPTTNKMLQRRGFYIDVSSLTLPQSFIDWVRDDTRAAPTFTIGPAALATLRSLVVRKQPVSDPAIIGVNVTNVIG
jgi:hypothetical protein